jgi:hypothetical protein
MIYGGTVVVENKIRQAVDVAGPSEKELVCVGLGIRRGVVEVMIPCIPL